MDQLRPIAPLRGSGIAFKDHLLVVVPQMERIVVVTKALAIVAVEYVESLFERIALGTGIAEPPLAECTAYSISGRSTTSAGIGCWPSGMISLLPRTKVCPVC